MPDSAAVLRLAEAERHRAETALDAHYDTCDIWPQEDCDVCCLLARVALRAATQVGRLRWKQALADEARAKRNRRGRRPAPVITGVRIPAPGQEQP